MTVLTLGLLPIMSGRQLIRAPRHGSMKDYCYHLIVLASKRSYRRTRDQKHRITAHPKLNTALQISDVGAKRRDRHFGFLHEQVGCALEILNLNLNDYVEVPRSNLMSEEKQGKMGRRKMYEQLSDATRLLASHKDISQHRRESLRPALNKDYRVICTTQQYAKLTSNEFLFGVDLSKVQMKH